MCTHRNNWAYKRSVSYPRPVQKLLRWPLAGAADLGGFSSCSPHLLGSSWVGGPGMPLHMPTPSLHLRSSPEPFLNRRFRLFLLNWLIRLASDMAWPRPKHKNAFPAGPRSPPLSSGPSKSVDVFSRSSILGPLEAATVSKPTFSCTCGSMWDPFITQISKPALNLVWVSS